MYVKLCVDLCNRMDGVNQIVVVTFFGVTSLLLPRLHNMINFSFALLNVVIQEAIFNLLPALFLAFLNKLYFVKRKKVQRKNSTCDNPKI